MWLGVCLLHLCPLFGVRKVRTIYRPSITCTNALRNNRIDTTLRNFTSIAYRNTSVNSFTTCCTCLCPQFNGVRPIIRRLCLISSRRLKFRLCLLSLTNGIMNAFPIRRAYQRNKERLLCLASRLLRHLLRRSTNSILHKVNNVCLVFRIMEKDNNARPSNNGMLLHIVLRFLGPFHNLTHASCRRPHDGQIRNANVTCFRLLLLCPPTSIMAHVSRGLRQYPSRQFVRVRSFSFFGVR